MHFKSFANKIAAVGVVALVSQLGVPKSSATMLTFDGASFFTLQNYGDRVTATTMGSLSYGQTGEGFTPAITVEYDPNGGSPNTWTSSYGDLTQVLYEGTTDVKLQVKFVADPGAFVRLHQWDLATYNSTLHPGGVVINGVAVYGASGATLFSQSNVSVPSVGHIHFAPKVFVDTALTLEIDARNITTGFGNEDVGLDNVMISQIPEPAGAMLVMIGAAAACVIGRRRGSRG